MPLSSNKKANNRSTRRILCIDGGGILGTFPAAFLAELEQHLEKPIGSYFDLIAGTSTGGILAIGLALGHTATDLLEMYEKRGPEIFGQNHGAVVNFATQRYRSCRRFFRNKHDTDVLREVLQKFFGNQKIGNAKTRLLVPAWNSSAQCVYIYKTAHHPRLKTDYKSFAYDAALATSAAPTYFASHVTRNGVGLLDGGLWANNPIALATVEAIAVLGWSQESLRILSLGCLSENYTIPKQAGLSKLNLKIVKLFLDGQSHGAMGMAKLLTGHEHYHNAIYRINQTVQYNKFKLDDASCIQDLKGIGHTKGRDRLPILEPIFFQQSADEFLPIHSI